MQIQRAENSKHGPREPFYRDRFLGAYIFCCSIKSSELLPQRIESQYGGNNNGRPGRPCGSAEVKWGEGDTHFPETNCKRRRGRHLPGQKPGLREIAGIRKRKYRGRGK